MSREIMQQALDAIKTMRDSRDDTPIQRAIAALEAELAKPEQEPVAYADALDLAKDCNWDTFICKHSSENHEGTRFKIPLYTAPPRKEWVGLTDDDLETIYKAHHDSCGYPVDENYERAIEAKLKEKNNDRKPGIQTDR